MSLQHELTSNMECAHAWLAMASMLNGRMKLVARGRAESNVRFEERPVQLVASKGERMRLGPIESERAAGALVGLGCGDALGAGYEGRTPGPTDPKMIGGGYGPYRPGEWTDDTQMAICIAQVTAEGSSDAAAIGDRFIAWLHEGATDVGIQTRSVLRGAASGAQLSARAAQHFASNPGNAAGNGSLMRTAPLALAHLGNDDAIAAAARATSLLTHGDPLAAEACVLWCIAIDRAVREGRLDGLREGLRLLDPSRAKQWDSWIGEAETQPPASFARNGFVVTALQAAYAAITHTPTPEEYPGLHLRDALRTAVSIGGDTDTVAAIAGGLLGARWGLSAIPAEWLAGINGWPNNSTARDLTRLAILTARKGAPDPTGWPATESMAAHYASLPNGGGTTAVSLSEEEGEVVVGDFGGLAMAGDTDVVISLCRMGTKDAQETAIRIEPWLIDQKECNPNLDLLLFDLANQICDWADMGKRVYIHCVAAESRTPTVAAAYLAERNALSGSQGLRLARTKLPNARPIAEFVEALERIWT